MAFLEVKNLTHLYGVGTGSGKSTLMQHLNGLLKPDAGSVFLDGNDIWTNPKEIKKVRFRVGMVFQYPEHQLFDETVYKDISYGPQNMGLSKEEIDASVRYAAELVGLNEDLLQKSPFELSGGEMRRAAIAGVLAMKPEVIVLDEPTAGLDPLGRDLIMSRIKEYRDTTNAAVLVASHSMEDIAAISDKVLVMNEGRLFMFDTTEKVFSNMEALKEVGLNVPQITKIMLTLKEKGYDVASA